MGILQDMMDKPWDWESAITPPGKLPHTERVSAKKGWFEGIFSKWTPPQISIPKNIYTSPISVSGAGVFSSKPADYDPFNLYHRVAYGPFKNKKIVTKQSIWDYRDSVS